MLEKLKELMKTVDSDLNLDNVTLDTRLEEDLHFDSLGIMMFAMAIEDEFNITFDEPMEFKTVKDVIDYIEANRKQARRALKISHKLWLFLWCFQLSYCFS